MLLGYKERFVQPILDGTKIFTMREKRKNEPKIGETLYMYIGLRTKHCKLITNEHKLIDIQKVIVIINPKNSESSIEIIIDNKRLNNGQIQRFVKQDGFISIVDFINYWSPKNTETEIKASLFLYHWTNFKY